MITVPETSVAQRVPACTHCGRAIPGVTVRPGFEHLWARVLCDDCLAAREAARAAPVREAARLCLDAEWELVCPPLFRETDAARLPAEHLAGVLAWQYGPEGLLILGGTGRGKTRAAWLLLERLFKERRRIVTFDALQFDHECVRQFRGAGGEDWADALARVDVVFFDDIDKGALTPRVQAELFGLIDRRCVNMLPTIATTNMTGDDLAAKVGDDRGAPMVRRLREFCRVVNFGAAEPA
jgi:hypothetical protein